MSKFIVLNPFQNVVASGIATTDLRHLLGTTISRIQLRLGGTTFTKAMMTLIQLKANGKVIWESTGSRTDSRMQWRGITANAAFLSLDFTEVRAKTRAAQMAGALDTTIGVRDLRLEVTIAGATAPTLDGVAEVNDPQIDANLAGLRPLIARVHFFTQTIGAAGTFPLLVPHFDPNAGGSIFKRIVVFSANMTGARVERNGIREFEVLSAAQNNYMGIEYGRTTQASVFPLDFMLDGFIESGVLDTRPAAKCSNAIAYGTFSAGETITVEAETLEPLDVY
jgi:hypothetical protein